MTTTPLLLFMKIPMSNKKKTAFTLVELLVVIAIIGILVALLLPAVQSARAAARRSLCQNSLKQIGLACLNYETTNGAFPAGVEGKGNANDDDGPGGNKEESGMVWGVAILPYMEEQAIYDQFDFSGNKNYYSTEINSSGLSNRQVGEQTLNAYLCPDDQYTAEPYEIHGAQWATSTYRACSGTIDQPNQPNTGFVFWDRLNVNGKAGRQEYAQFRGALVAAGGRIDTNPTKLAQISDGLSKTALVGEFHPGPEAIRKNSWASAYRYHSKGHFIRDDTGRSSIYRSAELADCMGSARTVPPGLGGNPNLCVRSFSSVHAGGVIQFVYCDGSVHAVRDVIDDELYLALGTVGGEEVVNGEI